ncbi:MAG: DUF2807 domain-containing protein [Bacteroidales bacterium]|nr:DUF2807 domain-containing protein [Bacteroidales bacterium]
MKKIFALVILACAFFSVNAQEAGNQDLKTDSRFLDPFEQVVIEANQVNFNLNISYAVSAKVDVQAESNLMQFITTEVKGKTLTIGLAKKAKIAPNFPITINLAMPVVTKIQYKGDGNISMDGVPAEKMELALNGKGSCKINNLKVNSSLKLNATDGFKIEFGESLCNSSADITIADNAAANFSRLTSPKLKLNYTSAQPSKFTSLKCESSLSITHNGAGNIEFSGFAGQSINATLSNTGKISMAGTASDITVSTTSAAAFDALNLTAEKAKVTNGGTGDISVAVSSKLDATISSNGSIIYKGFPKISLENTAKGQLVNKN